MLKLKIEHILAIYTIKDLETLCGIKAHTIRIWESRYQLVVPSRTQTNIRFYKENDLKDLLNIATLNKNGYKISTIAQMSKEDIHEKVSELSVVSFDSDAQINTLTMAMIEMSEKKFDHILTKSTKDIGFERTMLELVFPFLEKLGVLWLTGSINPVQENFVSCLIRQKMCTAIDTLPICDKKDAKHFLLYLAEGENQELSMLFMQYMIKSRGMKATYLGLNTSLIDLQDASTICKPTHLYSIISENYTHQPIQKYIDKLSQAFEKCEVLLSGYQVTVQTVSCPSNISVIPGLKETIDLLDELKNPTS
ncbi:MAG: MerR family transcriptional regulator [Saprospiraceae bacterium]